MTIETSEEILLQEAKMLVPWHGASSVTCSKMGEASYTPIWDKSNSLIP